MRVYIHIGPDADSADRLQRVLDTKRDQLISKGVLYARSPGARNHTRLFMASSDPDAVDTLRFNRGFILPEKQARLREDVTQSLAAEVGATRPDVLILSCHQLGTTLMRATERARLHDILRPLSDDIRIIATVDDPARMLTRRYAAQVLDGRSSGLEVELSLIKKDNWWDGALSRWPGLRPEAGVFPEVQGPSPWLDLARLVQEWDSTFGKGATQLVSFDRDRMWTDVFADDLKAVFEIPHNFGRAEPADVPQQPSAAWLSRARRFNDAVIRLLDRTDMILGRPLWRKLVGEIKVPGDPIDAGSLNEISAFFAEDLQELAENHPDLHLEHLHPDPEQDRWEEADPMYGFRPTQYLMAARWRINQAAKHEMETKAQALQALQSMPAHEQEAASTTLPPVDGLTPEADAVMPQLAKEKFAQLQGSIYAPHNNIGRVNEEELAAAFEPITPRALPEGNTGNVIVGCMKNEAPYIIEWVAYHRAMGVDNFLIYTNGCEDGTTEILDRLQEMGVLQHRLNDDWKGNSPQQYALNRSLKEPVIMNAEWIAHIDVDEFINVRCGNGTLQDFFERVPDATNVAMTWRLFGHNGVTTLADEFVIEQFDTCAPKFCPKPHTVWGYKTMYKNIGAYQKISCHRPNKLNEGFVTKVKWVNGSGLDMTGEAINNGWRSSKKSIGYDLLQLNHYALRSAESFLVKRQRGRALHVDRSIGLNYWIRMDWTDFKDITIKRNVPRLRAEYDRLMQDDTLRKWHETGVAWHRAKADELHGMPEFEELYQQALSLKLTETERVAYALALDLES